MMKRTKVCTNAAFYRSQMEGASFEESRAIVIGMYSQKELNASVQEQVRLHFEECQDCKQILIELQQIDEFLSEPLPIPFAVCPSSERLDTYHFHSESLSVDDRQKIADHLQECPLCKEEVVWLDQMESSEKILFLPSRNWRTYLPAVAAAVFLLISLALVWNNFRETIPEKQLQALAVIKEPHEVNFEMLEQTAPELPPADRERYYKGVTLFKQSRFAEASSELESVLRNKPSHSATQMLLGYSYYKLGKPEEAFGLCDRAEQAEPHSLERCLLLVNVALKTGHFDRAIMEITSLYHAAPEHPEVSRLYHQIHDLTKGRLLRL